MSGLKSDCRKFSPNVFNKTKCQNCFRTKESHSAEALESNRASRNVSKCGYLFVAPDWDFNVSVNRTKRWQRRWFVLYDDGELTYSLDQFPDTIPQGIIDMNKVLDVSDAEGITGNDFAISITTPDKVHFVKGTSKEESKWWFDALCRVSPRYLSRVKHKRNATFPCGKATIPTTAVISQEYCCEDDMRLNSYSRPKFLSTSQMAQEWLPSADVEADEDVFSSKDPYIIERETNNKLKKAVEIHNALNKLISLPEDCLNDPEKNECQVERSTKDYLSELEESENRRRNRRYLKRENRMQRNQRSRNDGVSKMIPMKSPNKSTSTDSSSSSAQSPNISAIAAAEKLEYLESIHTKNDKSSPVPNISSIEKDSSSESPQPRNGRLPLAKTNLRKSESLKNIPTEAETGDHVAGLRRYHSFKGSTSSHRKLKPSSNTSSLKRTKSSITGSPKATSTPISKSPVTATTPPNSNVIISNPIVISEENAKEGTFTRTGWLFRQTLTKDWSRHWFVLKDSSLTYYRDPSAEHCGIMDGILDLNQVSTIKDQDSDKFYAISLRMWDGKKHVLATETEEFRSMWITALQYASNLWSSASKEDFICTEIILPEHTFHQNDRSDRISSPSSLLSLSFADENQRAIESSSYSSDDQSEYFSLVDEDEISDLSSSPRTLPPSPPINRNVISLVKEKSRTRCNYAPKSNYPLNDYGGSTCNNNITQKNPDNHLDDDYCHKFQDFHGTDLPIETDNVFMAEPLLNGGLMNENEMPTSPITPPVEFMNAVENKPENPLKVSQKCKLSNTDGCSTCICIRAKLLTAQEEIRKLERELKEAHASFDNLEMFSYKLTQDIKLKEENYNSQIALMTAKIDDLTSKFTFAEKNYRQLKQKILKSEGKERRRSSLKNKEGLSLTKEYETKLCELEKKIGLMELMVKRDLPEVEMSENSLSDTSSKLSESCLATPSEPSETNTPTESVCSESKGFFSRLQSLISKVETVNNSVSIKDDSEEVAKNPKILLSVKHGEELSSLDESDEWPVHSSDKCNSPIPEQYLFPNYPKNLAECQIMLSQKLNDHFKWLKQSLDFINMQEKCQSDNLQSVLVNNLTHELNDLQEEIKVDYLVKQKILFLFEIEKILEQINDDCSTKSMLKINSIESTYSTIFQTLCITFAEYENSDFSDLPISEIPQFHFFCPSASKLFSPSPDNFSVSTRVSERLVSLESQLGDFLDSLTQAKDLNYKGLWNILADVPVQDDHINKPVESNSVLNCITFIVTDIHRIAELQLSCGPKATSYISKDEYIGAEQWFKQSNQTLKENLNDFLAELKDKCPMVNESTVSFYKLSETIRTDIIRLVVQLSFLNICYILLKLLLKYLTHVNQITEKEELSDCLLKEKWQSLLKKTSTCRVNMFSANAFQCSQCRLLNDLLRETEVSVNWLDFVQKYNKNNLRKVDKFLEYDSLVMQVASSSACANCDDELQLKNQKDVCNNITCTQCDSWIQKFCSAEKQHELEQRTLELRHNAEVKQLEECIIKSSEIHEQELLQKENELAAINSQLHRLKTEYEEQKQMLRSFYEEKLNFECESINEENIKDAYRLEIEDLKDMFKKGLAAIENSHNRITSEMERRHSEEISILEAEKQRDLEVEAQATITALEAIKKSHAQQLKEETALIKKDLISKFQSGEECDSVYSKYGVELGKLKAEIMKITEMYSSKCLENVALEEKVNSLRQQLKEAHNELCSLLSKNKEISASLFGK